VAGRGSRVDVAPCLRDAEQQAADQDEMDGGSAQPPPQDPAAFHCGEGVYQMGDVQARCWTVLGISAEQHC
jgi:hypothetical protein